MGLLHKNIVNRTLCMLFHFSLSLFPFSHFRIFFLTSALENICEFVLGQWLWCELIIGKVRPIHKCIAGYGERGPSQRRISGCLKALALGGEEGRPHRRFTGAHCLSHQSANPVSHLADYAHFPDRTGDTPQGEGTKKQGFYALLCLNNDVGSMNRGAHYSPWSFGSWPAASLVKAPVSNDPCQRLPRTAVMTYHTSSLRPHTDNYNHIYSFCCHIRPLVWQIDMVMRAATAGEGAGEWSRGICRSTESSDERWPKTPSEESQYQCSLHRVSFFTQVIVHSPPCPLKSHILPCLAKEHFLSVWALSLPSCFLQWGVLSCHTRCVKPFPFWWG